MTIPNVYLTSAVAIDDLGRIATIGSNGDAYLLTPTALGAPVTVPEPSTAMLLGMAFALLGLRSLRPGHLRKGSDRKSAISSNV